MLRKVIVKGNKTPFIWFFIEGNLIYCDGWKILIAIYIFQARFLKLIEAQPDL